MSKLPKISEVLHLAADEFLADSMWSNQAEFSCTAIRYALGLNFNFNYHGALLDKIETGLRNMGLSTDSLHAFSEFSPDYERQAARYNWLKFAALIAEEQGV
jgi:hypothetical protein